MNNWQLKLFSIFAAFSLNALEFSSLPFEFSSEMIEFSNNNLHLKKNVLLKNKDFKLLSDEARIQFIKKNDKEIGFSTVSLTGGVEAYFKNGGKFNSSTALLDQNKLIAQALVDGFEKVSFSHPFAIRNKKGLLNISSFKMEALLLPEMEGQKTPLKTIYGKGEVVFSIDDWLRMTGDDFQYTPMATKDSNCFGQAYFEISSLKSKISFIYEKSLLVYGKKAIYDPSIGKLLVYQPEGSFLLFTKEGEHNFFFEADELTYDFASGTLELMGQIALESLNFGKIYVLGELTVSLDKDPKKFKMIHAEGKIKYCFGESLLNLNGVAAFDPILKKFSLEKKGKEQIHYLREDADFYADHAFISFKKDSLKFIPEKCSLIGDVKGVHKAASKNERDFKPIQYVVASVIEMDFLNNKMEMRAEKPSRVLFYDKINKMQVSAEGLKLSMDVNRTFQFAKGIGDVRFRFVETELNEMKKKFNY